MMEYRGIAYCERHQISVLRLSICWARALVCVSADVYSGLKWQITCSCVQRDAVITFHVYHIRKKIPIYFINK